MRGGWPILISVSAAAAASVAVAGLHGLHARPHHPTAAVVASATATSTVRATPALPTMATPIPGMPLCTTAGLRGSLSAAPSSVRPQAAVELTATLTNVSAATCYLPLGGVEFPLPPCSTELLPTLGQAMLPGHSVVRQFTWIADFCRPDRQTSYPAPPGRYTLTVDWGVLGRASVLIRVLNAAPAPLPPPASPPLA